VQLPGASKHKTCLLNFTHATPGSQNSSGMVKRLVRSLCRVSAWEVPWVGLGRRSGPPQNKTSLTLHTPHHRVTEFICCSTSFCLMPMSSFSPWGGLGEPGEAWVKCGGKETTLGAHAPTRGISPKNKQIGLLGFCFSITQKVYKFISAAVDLFDWFKCWDL
jgi:hypothetical protein